MRRILPVLVVTALALALAAPVSAGTTRQAFTCHEHYVSDVGGKLWLDGTTLHIRDAVYMYEVLGDSECAGTLTVTVNLNIDFATMTGSLWGTGLSELLAVDGGYETSWTAHWTSADPFNPAATDIWAGQFVGHGYGAREGWQVRATIIERTHVLVDEIGYAFQPGD